MAGHGHGTGKVGLLAGIDVGTTNCKVGMYTTAGGVVVERRRPTPRAADDVVAGVLDDLRACLDQVGTQPLAVGVTGVAEGGVPLDRSLRPARPLLWWYDTCAAGEARWLADTVGRRDLFRVTGVDIAAKTPLAVWLWLRHGEPAVLDRMRAWVGLPELVATVLCGAPTTARTFAGRSGAFDQLSARYDEDLLSLPGIHPSQLPEPTGVGAAVARELGRYASGFLIDRVFGFDEVVGQRLLPAGCGLILAVDTLVHQPAGGPVLDTGLDDEVSPATTRARGAVAMKLLVIWRRDERRDERLAMSAEFVRRCAAAGLLSVLEGVVRPEPGEDFDELLLEAATELGALRPSLYKAQVPRYGRDDPAVVGRVCERVTATVPVPWVVLSQGVRIEDFPESVRVACHAGASGFLAGRGIWSDTVGATDPVPLLRTRSVDRLTRLAEIVDDTARPWPEAAA